MDMPEKAHQTAAREYDRLAPIYEERWSSYIEASIAATERRLALEPAGQLLDVGCGTGRLLARLRQSHPEWELTGTDLSTGMLDVAHRRLDDEVSLARAPAEQLPFANATFDVLVSTSAFHYIPDPARALAEMRRVLRPGARLLITDWCRDYLSMRALDRWLRWRDPAHFRTWTARELKAMLNTAGFETIAIERYRISPFWGLMSATARAPR
ncbi:methyltransferase domain-containing protein [Gammaproteobacteria bacterium AB-CW1]|uniref:Methyltransferase domain-containing protein n=1 Tax=Natronospira elongata TaxID=3110268 RepID=A0AAP6MKB4_9GAMM|nr:methyltransferase domain-containing protein [Gammaproteobacteria bacterium AB-CW1]